MKLIYLFSVLGLLYACNTTHKLNDNVIDENIEFAYKSEMRFKLLRKAANL